MSFKLLPLLPVALVYVVDVTVAEEEYVPPEGCPMDCDMKWDPVCSEDGNTFTNECHLEATKCQKWSVLQSLVIIISSFLLCVNSESLDYFEDFKLVN